MQSRACAGLAGNTVIYVLPGSNGACRDGWDKLISLQLDSRHRPCSILEAIPRFQKSDAVVASREATPTERPAQGKEAAARDLTAPGASRDSCRLRACGAAHCAQSGGADAAADADRPRDGPHPMVGVNWVYQVARKPSELFFPVSGTLNKTPAETWRRYSPPFFKNIPRR